MVCSIAAQLSANVLVSVSEVAERRTRLVLGWVTVVVTTKCVEVISRVT